jgi:hypothetical protein
MLAKRFNVGRRDIKLVSERFPNRIENKRYLIYLIENLVREAKNLAVIQKEMSDAIPTLDTTVTTLSESDPNIKSDLPL